MSARERSPGEIGALLRRLVSSYVPPERQESVLHVTSRLLESALSTSPSIQTAESLSHSMLFRLMRDGKRAESSKLAEVIAGLRFEPEISSNSMWAVLYVLNDLRGSSSEVPAAKSGTITKSTSTATDENAGRGFPGTEIVADVYESDGKWSNQGNERTLEPLSANPFEPGPESVAVTRTDVCTGSDSEDDDFFLMPKPKHLEGTAQREERSKKNEAVALATEQRKAPKGVPTQMNSKALENLLVHDLLLVVQGENGKILSCPKFDESDRTCISMPTGTSLPIAVRDLVSYVSELGFLFRIIRERVENNDIKEQGLVVQNMCNAMVREMDNYYRGLVTLRGADGMLGDDDDQVIRLTLRKIFVWAESEKPRLRWLARLCEETKSLGGGQILAHLQAHRGSYLPADIHDMMSRILAGTSAPINRMLQRWLSEGVLMDSKGEFFIMEDPKVAASSRGGPWTAAALTEEVGVSGGLAGGPNSASMASQRIWWGLFKVRKDQRPGSLDSETAQKALIAGKSIAFLRRCCSDAGWVDRDHAPLVCSLSSSNMKLFEADARFEGDPVRAVIETAKDSASKRLKSLFFDKFDLSHHFGAIKNYLLLSQGDFSQALMDGLAPILDGDAGILRNNLTGIVDAALQGCSSFNEETDQDILERLDVQITLLDDSTNVGWDVFSLTYRVEDAPLNTVFSSKVMDAYLLIFRLLWRLKRMDHLMGLAYMDFALFDDRNNKSELKRDKETWKEVLSVVRLAHFLRMKMTHVVQNMQHYCTVEVLEGSWTMLERDMAGAADLDGMIHSHSVYLTRIKDRTLLSDRSKYIALELNAVLDVIPCFDEARREISGWLNGNAYAGERMDVEVVRAMKGRIEEMEKRFNESFDRFLAALKRHSKVVDSCVFLLFRLDFNEHYARRREAERQRLKALAAEDVGEDADTTDTAVGGEEEAGGAT